VGLNSGEWLRYDRLILATGARSAPPDDEFLAHPNAFVLRSADDAQADPRLRAPPALPARPGRGRRRARRRGGRRAAPAGLKVTLLQRADRLMNAQLDATGAARWRIT
jgi:nitrite reductase (NADH) large subunit